MATEETREQLVAAAERLFARNGYAGTSLREITDEAGVNLAAVNYHFGSKEGLLVELLDGIVGPLNARRLELLAAAEAAAAPGTPTLAAILEAFLRPDLETLVDLHHRGPDVPRFVNRMYTEAGELMAELMGRQFADVRDRFIGAITAAVPAVPKEELYWRLSAVVGVVLYLFSGVAPLVDHQRPDRTLERLLRFVLPGMTAPAGEEVMASRSRRR